jgi:hypothetical protein
MNEGYEPPQDAAREKTPGARLKFTANLPQLPELRRIPYFEGFQWLRRYILKGMSRLSEMELGELSVITNIEDLTREDVDYYLIRNLLELGYSFEAVYEFWCRKEYRLHRKDDKPYVQHLYGKALSRLEAWASIPEKTITGRKIPLRPEPPKYLADVLRSIVLMTTTRDPYLKTFTEEGRFLYRDRLDEGVLYIHTPSIYEAYCNFCPRHGKFPHGLWALKSDLRYSNVRKKEWLVGRTMAHAIYGGRRENGGRRYAFTVVVLHRLYLVINSIWPEQLMEFGPAFGIMSRPGPHRFQKKYPDNFSKQPIDKKTKAG